MTPDEVMARLDPNEVRDMLAGAVERLAEPAEPDSRERLEARVAELSNYREERTLRYRLSMVIDTDAEPHWRPDYAQQIVTMLFRLKAGDVVTVDAVSLEPESPGLPAWRP